MSLVDRTEKELIVVADRFKDLIVEGNYEGAREHWENISDQGRAYILQTPEYKACRRRLTTSRI